MIDFRLIIKFVVVQDRLISLDNRQFAIQVCESMSYQNVSIVQLIDAFYIVLRRVKRTVLSNHHYLSHLQLITKNTLKTKFKKKHKITNLITLSDILRLVFKFKLSEKVYS